jgi:matrixin
MARLLLPVLTGLLLLAVLADRLTRLASTSLSASPPAAAADTTRPAAARLAPAPVGPVTLAPIADSRGTPTLDRLARLAVRQELAQWGTRTYLDSLINTTDSVIRRWPDRNGQPLKVVLVEGGAAGYAPRMAGLVRQALDRWAGAGVGVTFAEMPDSGEADILVRWIDRFDIDRAGQTDLTWDQLGRVRRATISLALHSTAGAPLSDPALLSVAVHETGHAIGLPHSADSNDVMFPSTRTSALSERDVRTAQLLYQLPPGSVKDNVGH